MPISPTPDFNSIKLDLIVPQISETALPTIGTPLDTTNFKALAETLSLALDIAVCIDITPEKINMATLMLQCTHCLIDFIASLSETSGQILFTHDIAKDILINGSTTLLANTIHS